jgi:hypothetical protein
MLALLSLAMAGCFGGEYSDRMQKTIGTLEAHGEKAGAVFPTATEVLDASGSGTGISLRLPVFVDSSAKSLVAGAENAQPPFADLPGFAYSYEIPFDPDPAYVYFAAVKSDEKPADALAQEVQAAVAKAFSNAAWQDVTVEDFSTDATKTLKRLSVTGAQAFGGQRSDGQFDLYLISSGTHSVLIGWRASTAAASAQEFFDKVSIAMGTVTGGV